MPKRSLAVAAFPRLLLGGRRRIAKREAAQVDSFSLVPTRTQRDPDGFDHSMIGAVTLFRGHCVIADVPAGAAQLYIFAHRAKLGSGIHERGKGRKLEC